SLPLALHVLLLPPFPTRRSSDLSNGVSALLTSFWPFFFQAGGSVLTETGELNMDSEATLEALNFIKKLRDADILDESAVSMDDRSEEHTSELQSRFDLVCRLLLE